MLDFNNLNYFPSLFEDIAKPRESYTISQNTYDSNFNYKETSTYKRYINCTVAPNYFEKAILHHESLIFKGNITIHSTGTAAPEANLSTDLVSYTNTYPYSQNMDQLAKTNAPSAQVEATANVTNYNNFNLSNNKIDINTVSNAYPSDQHKVTTENLAMYPHPSDMDQNNSLSPSSSTSINYNLNRDSASSTYSKYFYTEDINTTGNYNTLQAKSKAVEDTQVKLLVDEALDNSNNTYNKETYVTSNIYPVSPQTNNSVDSALMDRLHTNVKNSKIEPFSPYSPSIISDYSDLQVPNVHAMATTAPLVDSDITDDLQTKATNSVINTIDPHTAESISSLRIHDDLTVPEAKPTEITPPSLPDDYNATSTDITDYSCDDLTVPEIKPTKITPPLLDDDSDFLP